MTDDLPVFNPQKDCFMKKKQLPCVKVNVKAEFRADYECAKCLWRIPNQDPKVLERMEKLFQRYHSPQK
jgi:hypothetical protein